MMNTRRGEKRGWSLGWVGGSLWMVVASGSGFLGGRIVAGVVGLVLFAGSLGLVRFLAPWRHPRTAYWKLVVGVMAYQGLALVPIMYTLRQPWSRAEAMPLGLAAVGPLVTLCLVGRNTWEGSEPAVGEPPVAG
jgi:hypothetical protein